MVDLPASTKALEILIIDDHELFRDGLINLLQRRGIKVVGDFGSGELGLREVHALNPKLILLDICMPDENGLQVLARLQKEFHDIPVVILTTSMNEKDIAAAFRNGARGYLLKDMPPDRFVVSLYQVLRGEIVVTDSMRNIYTKLKEGMQVPAIPSLDVLTPRETEVLALLADGLSNKAIATRMVISEGTVKIHVKAVLRKLHVKSRVEAAIIFVESKARSPELPSNE